MLVQFFATPKTMRDSPHNIEIILYSAKSIPINTGETDPDINIAPINIHPDFDYYHHRNHILASIFLKLYVKIDKIGLEIVNLLIGYDLPICYQHT